MGTFFKQIYRYTRSRRLRHNENLWPYSKIKRDPAGHISDCYYRGTQIPLQDMTALQRSIHGDLLILATGPSVSDTDLTTLSHLPVMGLNGAWFINDPMSFQYYVIVDMTFLDRHMDMVQEVISQPDLTFFTTLHGIIKIIDQFSIQAIKCHIVIIEDACYKIYQPHVRPSEVRHFYRHVPSVSFTDDIPDIAFNEDIRTGIFDAGTVAYWALQIAAYLGADSILFAGLDMNNFDKPRFYETCETRSPSYLQEKFRRLILPSFELAKNVLEKRHIQIKNLSLNSAISHSIINKVTPDDFTTQ